MKRKLNNSNGKLSSEEKLQNAIDKLSLQKEAINKRAAELLIANKELAFQNEQKEKRAEELIIANIELKKIIAEGKKAEDALNTLNATLEQRVKEQTETVIKTLEDKNIILESFGGAFFALDSNWKVTYWNRVAEQKLGVKKNDIIGKNLWEIFPGNEDTISYRNHHHAMETKQPMHFKDYYPEFNMWYEISSYPTENGLSIFFKDITERKKSEKELKESEERFKALIENNQDLISLTDDALNTIYRSPSNERITGWKDEDLKVKGDINYFHPDDINVFKTTVAEAIKKPGIPQAYISRYLHKNGHYIWLEGTATKLPDDSLVKGIVFNSANATERIELEQLLLKATRLARIGSWEVDLIKQTVYWNDITREIHEAEKGFVPDLATGINFYKEGPGRELITQKIHESIELGKPWDVELQIITAQNNERWIRAIGETEFVDGKCVKIYGSFQDIDRRKRAEEKLIESANRYRRLFDTSPIAITEEDHTPFYKKIESLRASGISKNYATYFHNHGEELYEMLGKVQILAVNQSLLDLTGANNLEDFVANRSKFFVSMTEMTVFKLMDLIRDGGGYFEEETKIKSLSGEIKDVVVRLKYPAAPPYNSVAITMRDVTKQKEFEQKITESEEKYRSLIAQAADGIVLLDQQGYLLEVNKSFLKMIGYEKADITKMTIRDLITEEELNNQAITLKKLSEGEAQFYERKLKRKDGTIFIAEINARIDNNGLLIGFIRDITDRKKAEEEINDTTLQLRQLTSHLETIRDEERNRIAREIHDELGQQLTAMKMDVAWIDKKTSPEADNIKSKLKNIITLLDGSNASVRKILNELRSGTLDHYGIIEALEWHTIQFRENTGIAIQFSSLQTHIELPQEQANCIFRIYQESLTNIMRHAKASKVLSSLNSNGNLITLSVEDDGTGFNMAKVEHTKSFGLLGMKERVRALNGQFELTSSPGKGTKIVIHLPYKT